VNIFWLAGLVRDGLRNLLRHKLRSTLTLLGVVFGVAAVITMLGIGEGAQRTVLKEISALGLNNIIVDSFQPPAPTISNGSATSGSRILRYGLTTVDVEQIRAACTNSQIAVAHLVKSKVFAHTRRVDCKTLGVTPEYFGFFNTRLLRGRMLTATDNLDIHRVAVLAQSTADSLKGFSRISRSIRVGPHHLNIVGVVRFPSLGTANMLFLPYRTAKLVYGALTLQREAGSMEFSENEIGQVVIHTPSEAIIPQTAKVVRRILEANHENADFLMSVPLDILRSKQKTQRIFNIVLVSIAAISLVVGGIGIMNIMLAIVTERIPEIGLRRAIGARRSDIILQFLAETVTLSTLGGILGCVVGTLVVPFASRWTGWPGIVTPFAVLLSLSVSWAVGLIFGIAPAIRAARMDPVTALRYE